MLKIAGRESVQFIFNRLCRGSSADTYERKYEVCVPKKRGGHSHWTQMSLEPMMAPSLEKSVRGNPSHPTVEPCCSKTTAGMTRDYLDHQTLHASPTDNRGAPNPSGGDKCTTHRDQWQHLSLFDRPSMNLRQPSDNVGFISDSRITTVIYFQSQPQSLSNTPWPSPWYTADGAWAVELQNVLRESEAQAGDETRKKPMIAMQAGVVLAEMYINQAQQRRRLQAAEEREQRRGTWRRDWWVSMVVGSQNHKGWVDESYKLCVAWGGDREWCHSEGTTTHSHGRKQTMPIRERNEARWSHKSVGGWEKAHKAEDGQYTTDVKDISSYLWEWKIDLLSTRKVYYQETTYQYYPTLWYFLAQKRIPSPQEWFLKFDMIQTLRPSCQWDMLRQ